MTLPTRKMGRPTAESEAVYQAALADFCARLLELGSASDFKMSSRGWAYVLEGLGTITKRQIRAAGDLINDCRKSGLLPLDFTAEDSGRETQGLEAIDDTTPKEEASVIMRLMRTGYRRYWPFSFWRDQANYVESLVEKIDLRELFAPVCEEFFVPLTNGGGWCDINARAAMAKRFQHWELLGKRPVLLYCGDLDPGGFRISQAIVKGFRDIAGATGWNPDNLVVDRFGLNLDFVEEHNLPWIPGLETASGGHLEDPRHRDHKHEYVQTYLKLYGARKVEANSLVIRPEAGRDLCRKAILRYIGETAVDAYRRLIDAEQAKVKALVTKLLAGGTAA